MTIINTLSIGQITTNGDSATVQPLAMLMITVPARLTLTYITFVQVNGWWWIDAIQMGMPVFAKLGKLTGEQKYFDKMWDMYEYTRNKHGENGMYNSKEGLWWRDQDFDPPYKEPNGKNCYWSRGNGWVYAALVRVLDEIPTNEKHRADYINDFLTVALEC